MDLTERIARILFLDDMQPDNTQTGDRLWKRLCEQTGHDSEWHHTARRVIDELGLSEQRYPLGTLIFGYIEEEDA